MTTLKETLKKLINKDSYELYIWLTFLSNKMECKDCIATRKQMSGKPPDCQKCIPVHGLIKKTFNSGKGDK